jgi:hypothetical protein
MPRDPIIGPCRLCLQEAQLVDSHIVPAFLFKPLKKVEGRYSVVSTDPAERERTGQRGFTERLFCVKCDNERLQRNEEHLARVFNGGCELHVQPGEHALFVQGYDYRRIKNALVSILWRMSISKDPYFAEVSLGPRHEDRIRRVLLEDLKLEEDTYAVGMTAPYLDGIHFPDWIVSPDFIRLGRNRLYRCLVSGLLFSFDVGSAPPDEVLRPMLLRESGWLIPKADVQRIPFLAEFCERVAKAQAARQSTQA